MRKVWNRVNAFDAVPVPWRMTVLAPGPPPPSAAPMICEPVWRISVLAPLPMEMAVVPPVCKSPALMTVLAPFRVLTAAPL